MQADTTTSSSNRPLPKTNAQVCVSRTKEYYDYENSEVLFGFQDDYEFTGKLGRGRYSEVFKGVNLINNEDCVIKILKPVKRAKIKREIQVLETLNGHPYVVSLQDYVVDPSTKTPSIVIYPLMYYSIILDHGIREERGVPHSLPLAVEE